MGDRLAVGLRTLTPPTLVRIQVPQPRKEIVLHTTYAIAKYRDVRLSTEFATPFLSHQLNSHFHRWWPRCYGNYAYTHEPKFASSTS